MKSVSSKDRKTRSAAAKSKGKIAEKKASGRKKIQQARTDRIILAVMALFVLIFVAIAWSRFSARVYSTPEEAFAAVLSGKEDELNYMYNGFAFIRFNNLSYTQLQHGNSLYNVPFRFGPKDVDTIPVQGNPVRWGRMVVDNYSREFYVTFDPAGHNLKYVGLANGELSMNVIKTVGLTPIAACTVNATGCEGSPIITCEDQEKPVLYFNQQEPVGLMQLGNCLVVQGEGYDLVRATDLLLYLWYGIVK